LQTWSISIVRLFILKRNIVPEDSAENKESEDS
jgi:hypothetical protein